MEHGENVQFFFQRSMHASSYFIHHLMIVVKKRRLFFASRLVIMFFWRLTYMRGTIFRIKRISCIVARFSRRKFSFSKKFNWNGMVWTWKGFLGNFWGEIGSFSSSLRRFFAVTGSFSYSCPDALRHLWFKHQSLVGWTFFHPPPSVVNKIPLWKHEMPIANFCRENHKAKRLCTSVTTQLRVVRVVPSLLCDVFRQQSFQDYSWIPVTFEEKRALRLRKTSWHRIKNAHALDLHDHPSKKSFLPEDHFKDEQKNKIWQRDLKSKMSVVRQYMYIHVPYMYVNFMPKLVILVERIPVTLRCRFSPAHNALSKSEWFFSPQNNDSRLLSQKFHMENIRLIYKDWHHQIDSTSSWGQNTRHLQAAPLVRD